MAKKLTIVNTVFGEEEQVVNTKEVPSIDEQWKIFERSDTFKNIEHIDTEKLKSDLIADLTTKSQMDVREYTLYQKWCEVKEKFPVNDNTLIGQPTLKNSKQESDIKDIKDNIWIPKDADDFMNLKPKMVLSNGPLADRWNTLRTFSSTMKNNSNIGRNLYYTVTDEVTGKYLGVVCISSDFLDLTPRDKFIGWPKDIKTTGNMINHTAIGSTIVPLQPLGFNYMGGKLLALLCLSDTVQEDWKRQYGDILTGVTTTSLYGMAKSGGLSQYDGLEHWTKMGYSSGSVAFDPDRNLLNTIYDWVKENHTKHYFEWWEAKKPNGLPYKRDHKNRTLHFAYGKLKIPKDLVKCAHQRGIYFSPLYDNTPEFLRKEITEDKLVKSFDTSVEALTNIWKTKYAKGRIRQLQKKDNVSYETLFYDDLVFLSWEETKAKYLPQVGR
jgi:hypothetical protein